MSYPRQFTFVTLTHRKLIYFSPTNAHPTLLCPAKPTLWVIELHNGQDSRLTVELVNDGLKPALNAVEKHWRENWGAAQAAKDKEGGKGAVIIVGRRDQDKFFSNGKCRQLAENLNNP